MTNLQRELLNTEWAKGTALGEAIAVLAAERDACRKALEAWQAWDEEWGGAVVNNSGELHTVHTARRLAALALGGGEKGGT